MELRKLTLGINVGLQHETSGFRLGVQELRAHMAFKLECNTSVEASLTLTGVVPSRWHIMRHWVRYLKGKRRVELEDFMSS